MDPGGMVGRRGLEPLTFCVSSRLNRAKPGFSRGTIAPTAPFAPIAPRECPKSCPTLEGNGTRSSVRRMEMTWRQSIGIARQCDVPVSILQGANVRRTYIQAVDIPDGDAEHPAFSQTLIDTTLVCPFDRVGLAERQSDLRI